MTINKTSFSHSYAGKNIVKYAILHKLPPQKRSSPKKTTIHTYIGLLATSKITGGRTVDNGHILHHAATTHLFTIFIFKLSVLGTFSLDYMNCFSVAFVCFIVEVVVNIGFHQDIFVLLRFWNFKTFFLISVYIYGSFCSRFYCVSQTACVWFVPIRSDQIRLSSITFWCNTYT